MNEHNADHRHDDGESASPGHVEDDATAALGVPCACAPWCSGVAEANGLCSNCNRELSIDYGHALDVEFDTD